MHYSEHDGMGSYEIRPMPPPAAHGDRVSELSEGIFCLFWECKSLFEVQVGESCDLPWWLLVYALNSL